jgi:hypothetical protein
MSRLATKRSMLTAAFAVGVAAVLILLTAAHSSRATLRGSGASTAAAATAATPGTFRISGSVGGLYPGGSAQLVLTVANPQHFAIVVTSISTAVGSPTPGCAASFLHVAAFAGALTVGAESAAQVSVPVVLDHAAPDACQGAVFPLQYAGVAGRA